MLERICSACDHGNSPDITTCVACGAQFEQPLVHQPAKGLVRRLPQIPQRWQPAAKALALGATALAIEVGAALVRQQKTVPTGTALARRTDAPKLRVVQRRVWRTYHNGVLERETHEETQWFGE